jgi:glycosyltransferase involved in cell wall biosynthesis
MERFTQLPGAEIQTRRKELGIYGKIVLLHFARDWHLKGGDLFLGALSRLPSEFNGLMVGADRRGREAAEKLGVANRVRFLDPLSNPAPLYSVAHLFVASSRFEGMPYSVLESLASGVGIAATDIPAHREILEDAPGCTLAPLDPDSLAASIVRAYDSGPGPSAIRAYAMDHYSLGAAVLPIVSVYERLLGGSAHF